MRATLGLIAGLATLGLAAWQAPRPVVAGNLGDGIPGMTDAEKREFNSGRQLFVKSWQPDTGFFNALSCITCHGEPTFGGSSSSPFNVVFFVENAKDPTGFETFPWLVWRNGRPSGQRLPFGDYQVRRPQPLYGMGLIEAIPASVLKASADPNDANRDGLSGRVLELGDEVGRFGWKANKITLEEFTFSAFHKEIGVTTQGGDLTPDKAVAVARTMRFLSPPKSQALTDIRKRGETIFGRIGCGGCHTPEMKTGDSPYPSLANRTFRPYSNFLLHDVARGKPVTGTAGKVDRRETRTAPLWGLSQHPGPYWSDGSSKTLEEAIERHEGEALGVMKKYRALNVEEKKQLMAFLRGL